MSYYGNIFSNFLLAPVSDQREIETDETMKILLD